MTIKYETHEGDTHPVYLSDILGDDDEGVDLLAELFSIKKAASAMGKIGGSKKSEAKSTASRTNGKLGGRPRKVKDA